MEYFKHAHILNPLSFCNVCMVFRFVFKKKIIIYWMVVCLDHINYVFILLFNISIYSDDADDDDEATVKPTYHLFYFTEKKTHNIRFHMAYICDCMNDVPSKT